MLRELSCYSPINEFVWTCVLNSKSTKNTMYVSKTFGSNYKRCHPIESESYAISRHIIDYLNDHTPKKNFVGSTKLECRGVPLSYVVNSTQNAIE